MNPLLDAMAIGSGGALEGVDVNVGGLENLPLENAKKVTENPCLVDGCLTFTAEGSVKCVLTNSGRLRWNASESFMNVYELQEQMNTESVLKAVSAMSLDQVVLIPSAPNEEGGDAIDVLLGSSVRGKVIVTVDDKFGADGVFTAMKKLRTFNTVESESDTGILIAESPENSKPSRAGIAIGLDHGMWRRAVEMRDGEGE